MTGIETQNCEGLLGAILETANGAIIAIDTRGIIQRVNPSVERMFGYAAHELVGKNVSVLMPEPHASRHDGYIARYLATGTPRIIGSGREETGLRKDGTTFPIHLSVSAFEVDGRKYFAGIVHDLSARARLQAEFDRQSLLFQAVFDHVPEALLITDGRLNVLLANPAVERMFGYKNADLAGQSLAQICDAQESFAAVCDALDHMERENLPASGPVEARLKRRDGQPFPAQVVLAVIGSSGGTRTGIIVLLRDVTAELKQEQALLKAQRLEAIGQLTGGVAHDFNNLLTIIGGNLELIDASVTGEQARDHLRRALRAVEAGSRLTNRLLTFARRRRLEPQTVNLNDQVRAMTELLRRTLGETVRLSTVLAADLWTTRVDPSEVENAILNLAINARDAMPGGGLLVIETANARLEAGMVAETIPLKPGEYVRLSVSDTGSGMSPEVLRHAFEPFFSTKPAGRGTGLGLSTIYGFVRQSNGHVTIYSEPGKGTTVNLYLPREEGECCRPSATKQASEARNVEGALVLVVEDNPEVRAVAVERLRRLGYGVAEAGTAIEAVNRLESGLAANIVFSDVVIPGGMSGFDLARWLRVNRPQIAVLLTSGFAEDVAREAGGESASLPILRKPYTQQELGLMLRAALDRHAVPH